MKALQIFSDESLKRAQNMSTEEILRFLEEFRLLHAAQAARDRAAELSEPSSLELPGKK